MLHTQEVGGSNPPPPTEREVVTLSSKKPPLLEELPLRELLITLLGEGGRRRLQLRRMTNDDLFELYDADLVLRVHNKRNLANFRALLAKFRAYLGGFPPTKELAKGFLS